MKLPTGLTYTHVVETARRSMSSLDDPGFCLSCGHEQDGCEPDMRDGECESCGEMRVWGAEELMFWLF